MELNHQVGWLPIPLFLSSKLRPKDRNTPTLLITTCLCRGKFSQLFVGATDRYADFTTSLRLNANFTLAPRALRSDFDRAKFAPGFEA